ncbi:MAG: rhamnulokinase, partial [Synergistaceae bacterium]|nr:rhamnulokinase [Synergistaceae bacterium]
MNYYLAVDIGASSGRHILGWKEDGKILTRELYRFPNGMKELDGHLTWDIHELFSHVQHGIDEAMKEYPDIKSLSIDT